MSNTEQAIGTMASQVDEITARSRRIETSLFNLREHFGLVERKSNARAIDSVNVEVDGWDVSVSAIKRALQGAGWWFPGATVRVHYKGATIATIRLWE